MLKELCESLLSEWCDALIELPLKDTGKKELDGAIWCPACKRIHGRCFEAMYPFLCIAHNSPYEKQKKLLDAANRLFMWAELNISQPDGSFINDTDSDWKGTTVFNVIQLADCLLHHREILPIEVAEAWSRRLRRAADFLSGFNELMDNNINYPVANGLALLECGLVLKEQRYIRKAREWMKYSQAAFTENGLIFGEGVPRYQKSPEGCVPVDIGYNVEETLPSMALFGWLDKDAQIMQMAEQGFMSHLDFMLEDGAWDNSFGTRNFKWTYWGSRTTDGCALGYLLYADEHPEFVEAAGKNLELLKQCTFQGLLAGGPHYEAAGQKCCIHHTFTHSKTVAGILDWKLFETHEKKAGIRKKNVLQTKQKRMDISYYKELNTWLITRKKMRATVTAYDWEYLSGGHVSGGTLSLLFHGNAGILICAGMGEYSQKEPANMQVPREVMHECLAPRIEYRKEGILYSSIYESRSVVGLQEKWIVVKGRMKDIGHTCAQRERLEYELRYLIREDGLDLEAYFSQGRLICPLVSRMDEEISFQSFHTKESEIDHGNILFIHKKDCILKVETDSHMELPYGTSRIFNLVPGLQAIRIEGKPQKGRFCLHLDIL